jgi:Tc toxin complex TcA C-terminal TcB-binding domain
MAGQLYLVVRLIPKDPIDGATFTTYLEGLQLQVFDAYSGLPLSDIVYSSPLSFFQWPLGYSGSSEPFFASGSTVTTQGTPYNGTDYGRVLNFSSTAGMSVGSYVFTTDGTGSSGPTIDPSGNYQVVAVTATTATLNNTLSNYVPPGTVVSFIGNDFTDNATNPSPNAGHFPLPTTGAVQTGNGQPASQTNPFIILPFASTTGVAVGMLVTGTDIVAGATVAEVTPTSVTLSAGGTTSPPTGTQITFTLNAPFASLTLTPTGSTTGSNQLTFSSTAGIAFDMTVNPIPGHIPPGTTVTAVTNTTVTLSQVLVAALPGGQSVTFTFPLSSGIVQHLTETVSISWFVGLSYAIVPTSVATAVIPLNLSAPAPDYLNLTVTAVRPSGKIPINKTFYNVLAQSSQIPDPGIYQLVPDNETSFYLVLPPVPGTVPIALDIPNDGTPPPFDALYQAVEAALSFDPIDGLTPVTQVAPVTLHTNAAAASGSTLSFAATTAIVPGMFVSGNNIAQGSMVTSVTSPNVTLDKAVLGTGVTNGEAITFTPGAALVAALGASTEYCTRIAYDIVWSYQNSLPIPPDPLESLYTNPPNPGNSSTQGSNEPVLEQDRQKFEGTLNSFYSTRNATAERLAKFIAAVSAAVYCELTSVNATSALLEFPVDPSQPFASAVESEVLLQGVGGTGANAVSFGVPAAFFYALGAKMDKSTTAVQRYQMAAGDAIDRLLQEFAAAEDAFVIDDSEAFSDPALAGTSITSFQAARRLVALGVSAASGSPAVTLNPAAAAGTPEAALVTLVNAWLSATDPNGSGPPPNPPPTYTQKDYTIWQNQLAANPAGYVALDLYALTQGYSITAVGPLADQILAASSPFNWPSTGATVHALKAVTSAQWTTFFTTPATHSAWLPPFTLPVVPSASQPASTPASGYISARIRAFIRAVQKFFTVSSIATAAQPWVPGAPPTFPLPANDPIGGSGLTFDTTLTAAQIDSGAALVFSGGAALPWLEQALTTVNELTEIAKVVPTPAGYTLPATPSGTVSSLAFSVAEALFARGFRNAADITKLSQADFQQALTGTIAYDYAAILYPAAQAIAASTPPSSPGGSQGFQPINPDGQLVNCIPPPCVAPDGPAAYLQELLKLSEASNCGQPFAAPASGHLTLGAAVAARRGPIGTLLASCANVETRLPLIDIVNECLEYMASAAANTTGTVYATADKELAGFPLCQKEECEPEPGWFEPGPLFAALPKYSTPAVPGTANQAVEPTVFDILKADFSACDLPYSQAFDVSRSYLRMLGSSRFDTLRHFRKCITEFVLDPVNPPSGFQSHLWRFPVRIETAIEYLGITPEEYASLFQGTPAQPCAAGSNRKTEPADTVRPGTPDAAAGGQTAARQGTGLAEFLHATCLTYCEFLELYEAVLAPAPKDREAAASPYPKCEPCCLTDYRLPVIEGDAGERQIGELTVFIRLWRKLCEHCGARYSFAQLWDICTVLKLLNGNALSPEFIRQLAAFQMLRDGFGLPLSDPADQTPGATGADRSQLLALWVGTGAKGWNWAVARLLDGIRMYAERQFGGAEMLLHGWLAERLDALSRLAGFNPGTADTWNSDPARTLRFAEVLAKILTSGIKPGALLYLFYAEPAEEAEGWFASLGPEETEAHPLELPAHHEHHSLWALRCALLEVEVCEEDVHAWTWPRVIEELRAHFGYAPPSGQMPLLSLAQHLFPCALEAAGFSVTVAQRQYSVTLSSTASWNNPPGPLHYDATASRLWVEVPLSDEALAAQLGRMPELNATEQAAVSDLYFAPRADLGQLAFLFPDWQAAERALIHEPDEHQRWWYFRRHLALAVARRKRIAEHLARHVAAHAGCQHEDLHEVAALVLSHLLADENTGTPWETDTGVPPTVMWTPPAGGAVAALLALTGTGLRGDYEIAAAPAKSDSDAAKKGQTWELVWRDVRGPMEAFGHQRDETNSPVPTVIPPLALPLAGPPVNVRNGYASLPDGRRLGGAGGFRVCWSGMLLVEHEGEYVFHAGAPAPEGEMPHAHHAEAAQWRVTLQRGPKPFLVLNHQWPGETGQPRSVPRLRRGAYRITVEFAQPAPDLTAPHHHHPHHTGFQLKYAGPDSCDLPVTLPLKQLYRDWQDATLDTDVTFLPGSTKAQAFLKGYYTGTLRDIRRTYQRAFKAVLFSAGLGLSARREDGQSELGYMLADPAGFAGHAYYRTGANSFATHLANFDFDFLPITDDFHPPTVPAPNRSAPSLQRTQAMFDWWERLFDYVQVRKAAARHGKHHIWLLFREAMENNPSNPASLLGLIGAGEALAPLELRYYQDQNSAIYAVSSTDLTDDRWLVRVWHAQTWLNALQSHFQAHQIAQARPDLWVAADSAAPVPPSGVAETGNANLTALVNAICLATGEPRRLRDLRQVNDGLRERGRAALLAYLCVQNRVALPFQPGTFATKPEDIADLLLLDVRTGLCETASRIEEAITAVQSFIRRARLTLEPGWKISHAFVRLWDSEFASFHLWQRAKRRTLYAENWIEWEEIGAARRIEAFRFLESELRDTTLTLAAPGGTDWWVDEETPLEFVPKLLQRREPSALHPLTPPPASVTREGLGTLGSPEETGTPSWLTPVPAAAPASPPPPPPPPPPSVGGAVQTARAAATAAGATPSLPLWMQAAAELGTAFLRVAAAGVPPAALPFAPRPEGAPGGCCGECHEVHPWLIDEYYFWLVPAEVYVYTDDTDQQDLGDASFTGSYQFGFQDSFYDQIQQQSAEWDDEDQVPQLLAKWQPQPAVRLAWCRVHNGQFGQQRKSDLVLQVTDAPSASDLVFLGRVADSLYFGVSHAAAAPAGYTDKSASGFRYDLASDSAVTLPEVLPAPAVPVTYPAGLPAYPFYAYNDPGAPLFPRDWFAPAIVVADALRVHCDFELALKWYSRAFDPLHNDCTWMDCTVAANGSPGGPAGVVVLAQAGGTSTVAGAGAGQTNAAASVPPASTAPDQLGAACCDSANVPATMARQRALTLRFCETLLDWGDAIMRHRPAPEGFQQARLLFATAERITGRRPRNVALQPPAAPQPVSSFTPAYAALNPRLLDLYARVEDRLDMLNACMDARRLRNTEWDLAWFGNSKLREGWRTAMTCADEMEWCHLPNPYRFTFLVEKATELTARVRELGAALLAAYEKGDAEYLASMRAGQEREMLTLGLSIQQDQWRDADWQVQALQQTKDMSQTNLIYYTGLYQNGLLNNEIQNITLATNAMQMRTSANITEAFGEAMKVIPDIFVGFCSSDSQVPVGTKLAGVFETIAKVMMTVADVQAETAAIDLTEAGWQRRSVDWFHQTQVLPIEIQQIELQILGAQRRRDQAMQELNNQQRQIENAGEVLDFLRDKFSAAELYLWLQKETAALYRRMYELAHRTALQAQHAFNLERGHTTRHFLPDWPWDDLHAGLLAGERLEAALHHMEMAYLNENVREYELAKHISLRQQFPMAFLRLRATGRCEIDIPEWMFDLDYPGHYMRRIRSVSLTIPCVTGPYTGVHCRLTLLGSTTRIDTKLAAPTHGCCCATKPCHCGGDEAARYRLSPDDPRAVKIFGARDAMATSNGVNDSGLFQLDFSDARYLPFEYMGAVSRWRLELPPENNYFDPNTLTDTVLHLNYTAREGGDLLRHAASAAAAGRLPGDGWSFFDLRHDFPDAWELFHRPVSREGGRRDLAVHLSRKFFPYLPHNPMLRITRVMLLFETAPLPERPPEPPCCCPEEEAFGAHVVTLLAGAAEANGWPSDCHGESLVCRAAAEWPDLYSGMAEIDVQPFGRGRDNHELRFSFPENTGEIVRAYLFCRYEPVSAEAECRTRQNRRRRLVPPGRGSF